MTIDSTQVATPEFRAQLEWEVMHAFRHEVRIGTQQRMRRRLRAAAIVGVSLAVGTVTGLASAQVRDVARRDSLIEIAQAELALARVRLELAQAAFADASKRVKVGAASNETLMTTLDELRTTEARVARVVLNMEETRASLQPPRDELNAPLVDGRDFVTERIQLDLRAAQQQAIAAERALAETDRQVRVGMVSEVARPEAELAVERARAGLAVLAERLALRREFVEKGTPADQLMSRLESSSLRQDIHLAQAALGLAQLRLKRLENMRAAGLASEVDLLRSQLEIKERELELQRAAEQLRRLDRAAEQLRRVVRPNEFEEGQSR